MSHHNENNLLNIISEKTENSNYFSPLSARISQFNKCWDCKPSYVVNIVTFLSRIVHGTYREQVDKIRQHIADGDCDKAKSFKRELMSFSISGVVLEGGRENAFSDGRFQHSGFLQADIDAKDLNGRNPDEIKVILARDEYVQAVFFSVSHGVKAIIRVPICNSSAEHYNAFKAAAKYFHENYDLRLDPQTKDPVRLCFVSYDPDAYINYDPVSVLPVPTLESDNNESTCGAESAAADYDCEDNSAKYRTLTHQQIRNMLSFIPPRRGYDDWLKISSAVWAAAGDEKTGTEFLKEWSPEEKVGEYAEKFKHRLTDISAGTLIHYAREHGFTFALKGTNDGGVVIPDGIFPVPAGEIEYKTSGEIIFSSIAPTHKLFFRGGSAHEVIADGDEPAHFAPLSPERLCSLVENYGRVARREWQESADDAKGKYIWRSCRLPLSAAKILLRSDVASEHLPHVRQLAACAILTKEGRGIGRGYHAHAGGTYITGGEIPQDVPVVEAVTAILGLLDDFNLVSAADKSRAVASIISPALKMGDWIDDDFPLDVAEADQSQSGKSYRLKLVNRIYNEIPSAITAPRGGVGSLDETISAALIKGGPFITLDNFRGKLDTTILEQAIRGMRRVSCRALRISADVDTRPFNWQLSTNGAEFTRDIANRSIITRIRKQPPGYRFKEYAEGSLEAHVAARQPFYLGAVLSIIREWSRNGCPKTTETRHDFRGWCQSLDWIVQNIFKLAPLLDGHQAEQSRTANPSLQWLREVAFAAQSSKQVHVALTTAQLVSIAEDAGIEFPGHSVSLELPHKRAGKILSKLFRETEGLPVVVDGITVTREERVVHVEGRGNEMQKLYTFIQNADG
jgi:hypothetical protein